jgi:YVTN family beta-propeller protein
LYVEEGESMNLWDNTTAQPSHWELPFFWRGTPGLVTYLVLAIAWLLLVLLWPAATSAAPFAYVTNELSDTVSVIDTATNNLVVTVEVRLGPEGVAANPTGTRVYVANLVNETISVIDTATNTLVATVPVDVDPFGVAVNSAGTRVYVTDLFDGTVSIIDTETNSLLGTVNLGK